ncbi:hypothetical protein [Gallaecimonas sp. GXIMD4217]|uniref:hypothetical protein n=1 Tax=Gallaecimonas sp. GXIMD4217 TaxID=3131927 RepID=UPI00311B107F
MLKPRQQGKTVVNRPAMDHQEPAYVILGEDELTLSPEAIADFGWEKGDHLLIRPEGATMLVTNLSQRDVNLSRFHREARGIFRALEDETMPLRRVRIFDKANLVQILEADDHQCDDSCEH